MNCSRIGQPFFYLKKIQKLIFRDRLASLLSLPDYDVQNPFKNLWIKSEHPAHRETIPT